MALLICFSIFSCKTNNEKVIDLTRGDWKPTNLKLSDIASDVTYVVFESNKNCFFSEISNVLVGKSKIIILDRFLNTLLVFDRKGNFIRKNSEKGHGPGEYNFIQDFTIDQDQNYIYINNAGQSLQKFKLDSGHFIEEFNLIGFPYYIFPFSHEQIALVYPQPVNKRFQDYTFAIINKNGAFTNKLLKRESSWIREGMPVKNPVYYS